jgi:nucleoside-diphosphate-sugar epimerase
MSNVESSALIGFTGFVGSNLRGQRPFDALFNSANIDQIADRSFDLIVCAGARAEKWLANAEPERDLDNIERLIGALCRANARRLVLISTVDVFVNPIGVDEDSPTPMEGLHAYGRHRRRLEQVLSSRFDTTVVRLPALYGRGLKKNAIYDLLHGNAVEKIDSRGVFQFYNVARLWRDVGVALDNDLPLIHLPPEPVSMADVARVAFGREFRNEVAAMPARYDIRTRYAGLFGPHEPYIEDAAAELAGLAAFVAEERAGQGMPPA